ncbi:MAG: ComEC/Rec2 family competence protein [Rhodospirillaceae bacterium]|nr:ComEC/Rec2 family competence protein [Rhodospirillaceae bacterium]
MQQKHNRARVRTPAHVQDRSRAVLWLPVLVGAGIAAYFSLTFEPALWFGPAAVVSSAAALWLISRRANAFSPLFLCVLALMVVCIGFSAASGRTWSMDQPSLSRDIGPAFISGQVARVEVQPKAKRVTLEQVRIENLSPAQTPARVRIKLVGRQPSFQPGDWISVRAELKPPSSPVAPGAFDFQRQSYFQGLGAVGFSYGRAKVEGRAPESGTQALSFQLQRLRENIGARVRGHFATEGKSQTNGAVVAALMIGERAAIPKAAMQAMRDSGLAHLLAISGLHVGLVAGILFFSVRAALVMVSGLAVRVPVKKWAAVVAILGALAYTLLAGATVPTQRAFMMAGLVLVAVIFDRQGISMRLVAWAALAILLVRPESLLGASFQMSFAAVVALVAVYEEVRERSRYWRRPPKVSRRIMFYIAGVALTTLVAGLATSPIAAFHFNRVAAFGLAANLLAVPVTALWIMPMAVVSYVLMPFGLEAAPLWLMGQGANIVVATAAEVASWPGAVHNIAAYPTWGLALVALGGLWLAIWKSRLRLFGAPVVIAGMMSTIFISSPDVLISEDARLAAVPDANGGYLVSTLRRARFERDIWLRRAGLASAGRWPKSETKSSTKSQTKPGAASGPIRCDGLGCIYRKDGVTFAFVRTPDALAEDCARSDVVIAIEGLKGANEKTCQGPQLLITPVDLKRKGAHALWIEDGRVRLKTVSDVRGDRPWVIKRVMKAGKIKR